ncbi:nitrous oxide-stimulated promoter family protein [Anaerolinea sp.]|uniref:nitrous oxide-stimulated promoter family protein n=1 Tax=Anaerolinea sp. TaxID=1872519 RepID=UPI002ACD6003|nr:nitrous oxide-stimulated promoter family protein [Anaerolinea sp.]
MHPRIARERKTILAMSRIYCADHHGLPDGNLCMECQELLDYAFFRLEKCPYQEKKPTCANCPIHCYKPEMRERVRQMMRHAGPRMLLRHPILAIAHLLDGRKKVLPLGKGISVKERVL